MLILWRTEVEAFDERETAVLETFSAQAAIASRTLDLVTALEARVSPTAATTPRLRSS